MRRVPLVEQELLTLLEHLSSPPVFSGVHVTQSLFLCVMFCRSLFVLFFLAIVLSVLLRFTDSDCLFGIFKLDLKGKVLDIMFVSNSRDPNQGTPIICLANGLRTVLTYFFYRFSRWDERKAFYFVSNFYIINSQLT